jgi:Flp pilus assembly protein TadG
MHCGNNERGSVLVFVTLIVVVLIVMVGMGLDTGQLTYVRSQGQAAVDAAALSAASGLPVSHNQVMARAAGFNSTNDYVEHPTNQIADSNVTYVNYDANRTPPLEYRPSITGAIGVRVALEENNPYVERPATGITTPVFLTPLMRLFGASTPTTADISVSAVAVLAAEPSIPIAIHDSLCNGSNTVTGVQLLTSPSTTDNSCWTTYWDSPASSQAIKALFKASESCSGLPRGAGGGEIYLNNGVITSVYRRAEKFFIKDNDTKNRCWLVPVVPDSTKCNQTDPITDWAKICPTHVKVNPSTKDEDFNTDTSAQHYIIADVTCNQQALGSSSSLCFRPRLVRDIKSGM